MALRTLIDVQQPVVAVDAKFFDSGRLPNLYDQAKSRLTAFCHAVHTRLL
jgi:hypothetical protein